MKKWMGILLIVPHMLWSAPSGFEFHNAGYFHRRGMDVLVFSNEYDSLFGDAKISGIEIILHDERIATNGDVRMGPTPGQWDPISKPVDRRVDTVARQIVVKRSYPEFGFSYGLEVVANKEAFTISVFLETPIPDTLKDRVGLNLEFLPSAYFGHSYRIDNQTGLFPRSASGSSFRTPQGLDPEPLARGKRIVLSPEDRFRRITIEAMDAELSLYDGRLTAQNGWFVVRSLLPTGKTGKVLTWRISADPIPNWVKPPVIGHSQVGYHPKQKKMAVIECDFQAKLPHKAKVLEILSDGKIKTVYQARVIPWGNFLRYGYFHFDFTSVQKPGLYFLQFGNQKTAPFRIAEDVYHEAWHPTLDVFLPVQMDHMGVREAYRVWHGPSHLDDARQAPPDHVHFDLYAQGPGTDTQFAPGEHIPGLNIGGWFDAGDFDIRTQTQYATVLMLAWTWETFRPLRDQTTVDRRRGWVELHVPDGTPDILQQIEHGVLGLLAQHRAVGHAISGIIAPDLKQYTHIGDAHSKTDNCIFRADFPADSSDGVYSGVPDDRWAFTTRSTPLNHGSASALAAAYRALKETNPVLADSCLATALRVWDEEESHAPFLFRHGNTTGGHPDDEKFKAAVELWLSTGEPRFRDAIWALWPRISERFPMNAVMALRAVKTMDSAYAQEVRRALLGHQAIFQIRKDNPFGVPMATGGWGGNGWVIQWGILHFFLRETFPDLGDPDAAFQALHYLYGCHPGSDISFVSGVGARSKTVAYGNNRADFSFIPGGIVPGIVIVKPNFPENKEDWPFLWGENEYVVSLGPAYIFLVHAVEKMLRE